MSKIKLDKYYTSQQLADYCTQKAIDIIGRENITELLETSAGNGVFLNSFERLLPTIPYQAYDIEPEDERIVKQDYLELDLDYKEGKCIIGNPPFGRGNVLSVKFFKKSIQHCDFIAFILPISQLNNNHELFDFDLIYSESLGLRGYSGIELKCCFNVYKKPIIKNKKKISKMKDIKIVEYRRNRESTYETSKKENFNYDIRIVAYGSPLGKIVTTPEKNVKEFCIKIENIKYKEKVINILKNTIWEDVCNIISTPNLTQWQVYKYLKQQIPELE